jgi:imidazolonepropionase-like amidohydrolase
MAATMLREAVVAVTHVTVIAMNGAAPQPDRTVIVRSGRIARIGPASTERVPSGARVLDGRGRHLIPGLWDMHAHSGRPERDLGLQLANGITGVRDMGGEAPENPARSPGSFSVSWPRLRALREAIRDGRVRGPRIVAAGVMLDGAPPWPGTRRVADADEARRAVRTLAAERVDFVKVGTAVGRDAYLALAAEAKRAGLPFAGHVPRGMTALEVGAAGQRSIEHLMGLPEDCFAPQGPGDPCRGALARLAELGTWQVPTLVAWRNRLQRHTPAVRRRPELRLVPELFQRWEAETEAQLRARPAATPDTSGDSFDGFRRVVGAMKAARIPLLAGTDCGNPYTVPGFDLHEELRLLVSAGLSPLEALTTATAAPARFLGLSDDVGTIGPGRRADLVLLEADPLAQIENTRRIASVIMGGAVIDRPELDRMRQEKR